MFWRIKEQIKDHRVRLGVLEQKMEILLQKSIRTEDIRSLFAYCATCGHFGFMRDMEHFGDAPTATVIPDGVWLGVPYSWKADIQWEYVCKKCKVVK